MWFVVGISFFTLLPLLSYYLLYWPYHTDRSVSWVGRYDIAIPFFIIHVIFPFINSSYPLVNPLNGGQWATPIDKMTA